MPACLEGRVNGLNYISGNHTVMPSGREERERRAMSRRDGEVSLSTGHLGELLRYWRGVRGKSQLDLALDTGVSQRHISFVESGRSIPSRDKLVVIAEGLDIPLRERNALLLAAGYAPVYAEDPLDSPQMDAISRVLRRVLRQHEPFPAVVMDRHWTVVMTNDSAPKFFGLFIDMARRPAPRNLLHLMFDPDGMRPFIADWEGLSKSLLERVHRESIGSVADEKTKELIATLRGYSGREHAHTPANATPSPVLPMIPIRFILNGQKLSYFSMITTVGAPIAVAAQELRVECMYPADDETEIRHAELMES
jgi:transcriptional regulator with XRE-family HTH domain